MSENEQEQRMARPRMASGAVFFDAEDRVLLVRPSEKPMWEIPGGYIETGESPLAACRREVQEELGITPTIGSLLVVDWAPSPAEGNTVLCVFDGES
ncbi:NUDIX hydrolase [Streptomyces durbertensis]|uniref:NUDIX hydrolase n=1 Tax=Streptomyces durbertensis TaxID=2448886 RepID=UPI002B215FAC|nr:NUDIX hydrolase [Streptomyces durbertensis]